MTSESQYEWLILIYSLPPEAGTSRVRIWRRLKKLGAVMLRNSVYILPFGEERYEIAQWLCQEIQRAGGEATLIKVDKIENLSNEEIITIFQRVRNEDYQEVIDKGKTWLEHLKGLPNERMLTLADELKAMEKRLAEIKEIDYFHSSGIREAEAILKQCRNALREVPGKETSPVYKEAADLNVNEFRGRTWVTRPRPHVDRIATAWLIRRFIDSEAKFAFAHEHKKVKEGIPFDYPGVEFGHQGEDCTFETFIKRFGLKEEALRAVAEIVHDTDLKDDKFARGEVKGVDEIIKGLSEIISDDHELMAHGFFIFGALYAGFGGTNTPAHKSQTGMER